MNNIISLLPSRQVILTISTIAAVTVMEFLIIKEYKFTLRMLILAALSAICTLPGAFFGEISRKLTYGEWLNMTDFLSHLSEYEGTHYIGRVVYTVAATMILWRIIMRKDSGTFTKAGLDRYLSIMSIFMLIQITLGRIGCIKEGCCYGKAYYGVFSVYSVFVSYPVMPAVQTELVISLITFIAVIALYIKKRSAFGVFCIGYGTAVFIAEFMYENIGTVMLMGMTMIQIIALILVVTGVIYMYVNRKNPANINKNPTKGGKA